MCPKKRKALPPTYRVMTLGEFLAEYGADGAAALSGSRGTVGGTKKGGGRATRTQLYRSHSVDHGETQKALFTGYRGLCKELHLDPKGVQATSTLLPFVIGTFNIGRAVMGRSIARGWHGKSDPGEMPEMPVEVEVDPGGEVRWRYAGVNEWTRAD